MQIVERASAVSSNSRLRLASPFLPTRLFQCSARQAVSSLLPRWSKGLTAYRTKSVLPRAEAKELQALIFDCDGVILESEDLHRVAYNETFANFQVIPDGEKSVASWSIEFYDRLQNSIGGGKPKMRWFFGKYGWPASTILPGVPSTDEEKTSLIDTLQDWKTIKYQEIIAAGKVEPRPGVLALFDEARQEGLKVGVCSAATKSSAICVLENLLGPQRFKILIAIGTIPRELNCWHHLDCISNCHNCHPSLGSAAKSAGNWKIALQKVHMQGLDVFLAGDDVSEKKPDPSIYQIAADRLQVLPSECLVIEDSTIGLQAALAAGMRCLVTYTSSTESQDFEGAERIVSSIDQASPPILIKNLRRICDFADDRL